jgi:farnesyl-diphosphate farnesyltransferase
MNAELTSLLRDTSRSFYLTLRVLPGAVRSQIGLAYLLARATDTIADTEILPVTQRLAALDQLRSRILGNSSVGIDFGCIARQQGLPAEQILLERIQDALAALDQLPQADKEMVQEVLRVITSGQELDLRRYESADATNVIALQNMAELDDYTYRVAGCVGEFWTHMCLAHLFQKTAMETSKLLECGIRFGKGLQLVNILRDLPKDLRQGRCYLPQDELEKLSLTPADLLKPANETKFRPLYTKLLSLADGHLAAGWDYTNALPWSSARVRLACAWPIIIGVDTLAKLRNEPVLNPDVRVKISRKDVRNILLRSVMLYPFPGKWRRMVD